jgi:hypothetical protein
MSDKSEVGMRRNHGCVKSSAGKGMRFDEPYGKDDSGFTGSATAERGKKMGGSVTNMAHSLSSTSAKQE